VKAELMNAELMIALHADTHRATTLFTVTGRLSLRHPMNVQLLMIAKLMSKVMSKGQVIDFHSISSNDLGTSPQVQ